MNLVSIENSRQTSFKSNNKDTTPKLYLLTNDDPFDVLYAKLEVALATGVVSLLQVRRKCHQRTLFKINDQPQTSTKPDETLRNEIEQICKLTEKYHCKLIINDDMQLAHEFGAGVHLGQNDGNVLEARKLLGQNAIIGRTCHDSIEWIEQASQEGASYVAMGAAFDSSTKPGASTVALETLIQGAAKSHELDMDFCVIGGITTQNVSLLGEVSPDYIAVVNDILSESLNKIEAKCQQWQREMETLN